MHAEIAGAGSAGLTAEIAFHRRGWTVRVHEKDAELRAFGAGIFIWENGLRVLHAIGAYEDVVCGAHQAPAYETRRNGVCVAFEKVNGGNRYCLLTLTRQHLYAAIRESALREGIEILTNSEAVGALPEGVLQLAVGQSLSADLVSQPVTMAVGYSTAAMPAHHAWARVAALAQPSNLPSAPARLLHGLTRLAHSDPRRPCGDGLLSLDRPPTFPTMEGKRATSAAMDTLVADEGSSLHAQEFPWDGK